MSRDCHDNFIVGPVLQEQSVYRLNKVDFIASGVQSIPALRDSGTAHMHLVWRKT